ERTTQAEPAEDSVPLSSDYGVDFELSMAPPDAADVEPPVAEVATPAPVQDDAAPPTLPPQEAPAPVAGDDVRLVGGLRIPLTLYNVYLSEADEWSRQLAELLAGWARTPGTRLPDEAVAAAHSLAGSSATVGFALLSELARLVESALQHLQGEHRAGAAQAAVLVEAAEDIRR
ncbi:Hpt domain-containing protein, partial [Pseudacidovorax intermedius]